MAGIGNQNVVFIFGAGTSREAGAPLMADFFDKARAVHSRLASNFDAAKDFKCVFKAIDELQRMHSKTSLDISNLEAVFSAFELAVLLHTNDEIFTEDLIISLKRVIARTIENCMQFNIEGSYHIKPNGVYDTFANNIKKYIDNGYNVTILSFNYDIGLDFALFYYGIGIDYCLSGYRPRPRAVTLLKLHGSLHWRMCGKCNEVVPMDFQNYFSRSVRFPGRNPYLRIGLVSYHTKHDTCEGSSADICFIVPPSWSKQSHYKSLGSVWRQANNALQNASSVFVCGYSMPSSDEFFKYLFGLGTMYSSPLQYFNLYDPDPSGGVVKRYKEFLGPGIATRFNHIGGYEGNFSSSISHIDDILTKNLSDLKVVV